MVSPADTPPRPDTSAHPPVDHLDPRQSYRGPSPPPGNGGPPATARPRNPLRTAPSVETSRRLCENQSHRQRYRDRRSTLRPRSSSRVRACATSSYGRQLPSLPAPGGPALVAARPDRPPSPAAADRDDDLTANRRRGKTTEVVVIKSLEPPPAPRPDRHRRSLLRVRHRSGSSPTLGLRVRTVDSRHRRRTRCSARPCDVHPQDGKYPRSQDCASLWVIASWTQE